MVTKGVIFFNFEEQLSNLIRNSMYCPYSNLMVRERDEREMRERDMSEREGTIKLVIFMHASPKNFPSTDDRKITLK
jgi:hypothetical protein